MSRKNLIIVILLLASALVAAFIREPDNGIVPSTKAESADTIAANVSGTDFKQLQQIRLPENTNSVELDYTDSQWHSTLSIINPTTRCGPFRPIRSTAHIRAKTLILLPIQM